MQFFAQEPRKKLSKMVQEIFKSSEGNTNYLRKNLIVPTAVFGMWERREVDQ